ncbi:MAG: hypothetical protein ACRC6C_01750 [Wolbachia pipientis]
MNSEEEDDLLLILLLRKRVHWKKKAKRKLWVHPLLSERVQKGLFHTLYDDLQDDKKFFQFFRMSKSSFDELLSILQVDISGEDTIMRRCIPAEEKLALTLR